ncbi:anaphase-promoting complex subunit 5-like [Salvia miltiorrhiza]|uniref:anaphase-promoting complex subunit 5-like n=1 Tax=Salvia miltiorrhiza TaxID=226208 RepID=UPI0025AD8E01|nr:anaphase-promoting complex subunit 5-like [Salvia miltiorrhiza]
MAVVSKPPASFAVTPHKLSICILVQVYAPPSQISIPFPFSSVSQHNRLGIFLRSLTKDCGGIFEPTLDELIAQLKEIGGLLNHWLSDHLMRRLSSLASPDDLFNLFADLRGIIGGSDSNVMDDDQIMLDPNSIIGMFIRRCLLTFNQMSFEGICHLLTSIGSYCKESFSGYPPPYESSHMDESTSYPNAPSEYENMDMENFYEKSREDFEESKTEIGRIPFYGQSSKTYSEFSDDCGISSSHRLEHIDKNAEVKSCVLSLTDMSRDIGSVSGTFLHTNWQVQGYLSEQANVIEK